MKNVALIPVVLAALCAVSTAADAGPHPATLTSRAQPGIDANTFIVGHPAGGRAGRAPSPNFDHPAIAMHRAGQTPRIDPNRFIVQPPATTVWIRPVNVQIAASTK